MSRHQTIYSNILIKMFFEFYTIFNLLISQPPLNLNFHFPDKNVLSIICRNESESKIGLVHLTFWEWCVNGNGYIQLDYVLTFKKNNKVSIPKW